MKVECAKKEIFLFWIHFTISCLLLSAKPGEINGVLSPIKRKKAFVFYLVALTFLSFSLFLSLCAQLKLPGKYINL